ncbi:MAG: hypothetical protein H8F28_25035, partial [Fibrella sp.]|nr:hypothetical protein [Armatimonadota bacterium]
MSLPVNTSPKNNNHPEEGDTNNSWSVRIAKVSGIPIRLHFTFILLLAFIGISGWGSTGLAQVGLLIGVFTCVVLHELGHSLVAQRYGYVVRD